MTPAKILAASLEVFAILAAVSLVHRLLAFDALSGGTLSLGSIEGMGALLIGFLSDLWVAYLGASLTLLATSILGVLGYPTVARLFRVLLLLGFGVAFALAKETGAGVSLVALAVIGLVVLAADPFGRMNTRKLIASFVLASMIGFGGHYENIALRERVAGGLKMNPLEGLYSGNLPAPS